MLQYVYVCVRGSACELWNLVIFRPLSNVVCLFNVCMCVSDLVCVCMCLNTERDKKSTDQNITNNTPFELSCCI